MTLTDQFGGFIVSKNIIAGNPIKYSFREKSAISKLNGWTLYSDQDDEAYINSADHFTILGADSMKRFAPVMLEILDAPYGTDLCWLYQESVLVGFYDLTQDKEVSIEELLRVK